MILFINAWVAFGLALFYVGPVNWSGAREPEVAIFVALCLLTFNLAYFGSSKTTPARRPMLEFVHGNKARFILLANAGLSLVILTSVTGRNAFDVSAYSTNFGQVYADYGAALRARQVGLLEQGLTLARAVIFPIALVAFIARFRKDVWSSILFLGPLVISSLFRGTDKELADVAILIVVSLWLHGLLRRRVLYGLALLPVLGSLFLLRRLQRFDGNLPQCLPQGGVCFDYQSWVAQYLGPQAEALLKFVTHYLTNGYQGLSLSFDLSWAPNFGIGHLPPVSRTACDTTGLCASDNYQSSLTAVGWDASAQWTSVYPILANDLSFWLVPVYTALLGVIARRCLTLWHRDRDPASGAGLILVVMFWLYSSINMQISISLEWAFATVFFLYVAPWRQRLKRSAAARARDLRAV